MMKLKERGIPIVSGSRALASAKVAVAKEDDGRLQRSTGERIVHGKDQIDLFTPKGLGLSLETRIGTTLFEGVGMLK